MCPMLHVSYHSRACSGIHVAKGNKFNHILFGEQCLPSFIGVQEYIVNMSVGQHQAVISHVR